MGVKFGLLTLREQHRFILFENRVARNFLNLRMEIFEREIYTVSSLTIYLLYQISLGLTNEGG
jgi:hypothetical protein